ncbi:MAG TPA: hypothetical protein VKU39_10350 [Streptosporangiaceae bacterium]|nr:hypothetical protein [Streptosporangiaceae bacterium]
MYRPRPGEEICVSRDAGDPVLSVCAGTHGFVAGVRVPAEETPAIARMIAEAMCEAAGLPAPVILDRPADLAPVSVPSGVVAGIEDGTILLSVVPGRSAPLRPGDARHLAAALAHFADHVESEPDPADVEALAEAISAGMAHCGGGPEGVCRVAAVTALRWMKRRKGQP